MDERDPRRHWIDVGRQRQREKIAADREQHIVLIQHFAHFRREPDHRAAKQRMRRGKRGGARHEFGVDGRPKELGQLDQLRMRPALGHRVAGHDHRALGGCEQRCRGLYGRPIAAQPRRDPRGAEQVDIAVGSEDVAGEREEYRPGRRRERSLGGAVNEPRQIGETMHFRRPLDQRARDGRKVRPQDGFRGGEALLMLAGGDEDGRARLLRIIEHAHCVAETRRNVQIDDGELARRLGVAVRHGDDHRLLQAEHVAQLVLRREGIHERQFRGPGIAEHDLDALLLEQVEEGALTGHHGQSVLPISDEASAQCRISPAAGKAGIAA